MRALVALVVLAWIAVLVLGYDSEWATTNGPYHGPPDYPLIGVAFLAYLGTLGLFAVRDANRREREDEESERQAAEEVRRMQQDGQPPRARRPL